MSWRIEEADALVLLRELPDRWAQTCVARPPRGGDPERTLAILDEVRRVLRDDGTLWVLLQREQLLLAAELREEGWTQQAAPEWAERATRVPTVQRHGCSCSPRSPGTSSTLTRSPLVTDRRARCA